VGGTSPELEAGEEAQNILLQAFVAASSLALFRGFAGTSRLRRRRRCLRRRHVLLRRPVVRLSVALARRSVNLLRVVRLVVGVCEAGLRRPVVMTHVHCPLLARFRRLKQKGGLLCAGGCCA
jgi:hypothetical protein